MDILQRLYKSVSGKTRIDILLLLLDKGELNVGEIAFQLNRKISTISRNLRILEKDNFLKSKHASSTQVFYSIREDPHMNYNIAILEMLRYRLGQIKKFQ
jgi:DNA-binding MarR family transcriptional regulator